MIPTASASPHGPPAVLAFACGSCGKELEVPITMAGVTGPCPLCGAQITSPSWTPAAIARVAENPAELLARPPRVRTLRPPEPLVAAVVHPLPLSPPMSDQAQVETVALLRAATPPLQQNTIAPPAAGVPAPSAVPEGRRQSSRRPAARPVPVNGKALRGLLGKNGAHHEDANEVVHRKPAIATRRSFMRWADVGTVGVFIGLSLACLAAIRYTIPAKTSEDLPGLPPNLNELVEKEAKEQSRLKREAEMLANKIAGTFLGANDKAAASFLLPPPAGLEMPALPVFAGIKPESLSVDSTRGIPGTNRFIVTVKPSAAPGPVFVLEQTDRGPLLHSGAITQQAAGLYEKFINAPGSGSEVTLYAEVKPAIPSTEREFHAQNPNLAGYKLIEILSLGKEEIRQVWMAMEGPAAQVFARRSHDSGWRRCIAQLRWSKDPGRQDFVEVMQFLPGTWSGDAQKESSALTAGLPR